MLYKMKRIRLLEGGYWIKINSVYKYMKKVIEVSNLSKKYGSLTAIDDISFEVHKVRYLLYLALMVLVKQQHSNV